MIQKSLSDFYRNQCSAMENFITPLKVYGVYYFSFARIYKDQNIIFFCNHQDWLDIMIDKKLFNYNSFIPNDAEKEIIKNYNYYLCTGLQYKDNKVLTLLFETNRWNSIDLYNKEHNYIDILHFSGTRDNINIINFFINNLQLLKYYFKHFYIHFKETIDLIIKYKLYINLEQVHSIDSKNMINPKLFANNNHKIINEKKLIDSITSSKKIIVFANSKNIKISNREHSCLFLLSKGKSTKEIAKILNLSPRTIEYYLENIKIKTGLHYKSELVNLFYKNFDY